MILQNRNKSVLKICFILAWQKLFFEQNSYWQWKLDSFLESKMKTMSWSKTASTSNKIYWKKKKKLFFKEGILKKNLLKLDKNTKQHYSE